jgi:hypothetical protein
MRPIKKTLPCGVVLRQMPSPEDENFDRDYVQFHIEPTGPEISNNFVRAYNGDEKPNKDFAPYKRQADIIVARRNLRALRALIDRLIRQKV